MNKITPYAISEYRSALKLRRERFTLRDFFEERKEKNYIAANMIAYTLSRYYANGYPAIPYEFTTTSQDSILSFLTNLNTRGACFLCDPEDETIYPKGQLPLLEENGLAISSSYSYFLEQTLQANFGYFQNFDYIGCITGNVDDPYYQIQVKSCDEMTERLKDNFGDAVQIGRDWELVDTKPTIYHSTAFCCIKRSNPCELVKRYYAKN